MNFQEYQTKSRKTAVYPNLGNNYIYPVLGLCGESGEVAEKVKKLIRDDGGEISEERTEMIKKELGDVLWYVAQVATEFKLDLNDIAEENIKKLYSRLERNAIHGDGDER
ncbi:nucleoside triphosphate pyrophosphohydrolase family protein [Patescibacteria group bacterium]|nr:nucleoside triphosphate pyrophosphohydrolase family protein [Patescibacteria group bacterium]